MISTQVAPTTGDVEWRNVGNRAASVVSRTWVADGLLCWLAVLWTPLIAFLQTLANIEELANKTRDGRWLFPWLRPFARKDRYETARYLIQGYLPVLLVLVLLLLIPIAIEQLARHYVGFKTKSAIQAYVLQRHFCFQLLTIFVTVLSGSALTIINEIVRRPAWVLNFLGTNLPALGSYFLQLLIVKSLLSTALELSKPHQIFLDVSRVNALINRSNERRGEPPGYTEFKYGHVVPQILMVVLVASIYAAIAPLLLPFAWLFFFLAELFYSRNFLLVYVRRYESGGDFLVPHLLFFTMLSLVVGQVTMIGYISIMVGTKQLPVLQPLLVPLPFLTYWHYRRLMKRYVEPSKFLTLEAAADGTLFDDLSEDLDENYYKQKVLTVPAAHPVARCSVRAGVALSPDRRSRDRPSTDIELGRPSQAPSTTPKKPARKPHGASLGKKGSRPWSRRFLKREHRV